MQSNLLPSFTAGPNSLLYVFVGLDPNEDFRVQEISADLKHHNNSPFGRTFQVHPTYLMPFSLSQM